MNVSLSVREALDIHSNWKGGKLDTGKQRPFSIALRISKNLTSLHATYIEALQIREAYEAEHGTPETPEQDHALEQYIISTMVSVEVDTIAITEFDEGVNLDEMSVLYFMLTDVA